MKAQPVDVVCARRPGQVLDRFQFLEHAWDEEYENRSNIIDVYVRCAGYRPRSDGGR